MTQNLSFVTSPSTTTSQAKNGFVFFKNILKESGLILSFTDEPNILTQEQALVVRDINKFLGKHEQVSDIEEFLIGLKKLCKKEKLFEKALLKTEFKKLDNVNDVNISIQQESLIRICLKVNQIQNELIDLLIEEIIQTSMEETQDSSWLRLLLNQLRYLPHINESKKLTTKLLDILEIATYPAQLEILDSIPEIIPDIEYYNAAEELTKLLDEKEELSAAIIDCLNALNLDLEIRSQIQDRVLTKLMTGTSLKLFPILLEFLLTDFKQQNLTNTFHKIRIALDKILSINNEQNNETESNKILIFNRLQMFSTPKLISDTWLNTIINIKSNTEHKPIDLLLLFMLYSKTNLKKRPIENLFRKKIKDGLFKCLLIEKLFEKYIPQQLLNDYFQSIIEIGCSLFRTSQDILITDFVSNLFKTLFNYKFTQRIYRQELLDNLILLTGSGNEKNVGILLKIFLDLMEDITKIQHHTIILMRLLEKIDTFHLIDVKQVFEILCRLTCGEDIDDLSGLKNEIYIIVRKQLSSSRRSIKYRGIISAVVMAKHIATTINVTTTNDSDSELSINSINDLPDGRAREAANLLELVNTCTLGHAEFLGLYYDQLAMILIQPENLNKYFLMWLNEVITCDFQNLFVIEQINNQTINEIELSMQYNLNSNEDIDTPISINIGGLTVNSSNNSILLLASHFRLLRLLHHIKQNGDLSTIDALLGCGIILPNTDLISILDTPQIKQVSDCLFHCINWFREIINGFVTQKSQSLRLKIIKRLNHLIEMEKLLDDCMENVPEHKLPQCKFDTINSQPNLIQSPSKTEKISKPPKKKIKLNETGSSTIATPSTSTIQKNKTIKQNKINYNFREMDTDLILLLKYPLDLVDNTESETLQLNIEQLKFILKDFVMKLQILIKGKSIGLSNLNNINLSNLINDCKRIFPHLNKHFNQLNNEIEILLTKNDGCSDAPDLLTDHATNIKICFGLILEIFSLVFSWSGFQHSKSLNLLRDLLKSLQPSDQTENLISANCLIIDFIKRLSNYMNQCLHLSDAINLINIMISLNSIITNQEIDKIITENTEKFLNKRWYNFKGNLDSGKDYLIKIDNLIKIYLNKSNVKKMNEIVIKLQNEKKLNGKDDNLEMLISINKINLIIFYRNLWTTLHNQIKIEIQSLTNNQHLILWRTIASTMQNLMLIAKNQDTKSYYCCFMKKSIAILKIFLSNGIPILEIMLRSKPDEIVEIFKTIQTCTRFIHHLCCQSKLTKDSSLINYIPQFRLTLETLVYRVKAALVANDCSAAFWMGNLKNKDIHGEDIISQSTTTSISASTPTDSNEANSDEELPSDIDDDNNSDTSDILNNDNSTKNTSGSEVYD